MPGSLQFCPNTRWSTFISSYAEMGEICVEYQWLFAKILSLSRSSTTFHWRLADIWRMFRAYNTYVSLKITETIIAVCMRAYALKCAVHMWFVRDLSVILAQFIGDLHRANQRKLSNFRRTCTHNQILCVIHVFTCQLCCVTTPWGVIPFVWKNTFESSALRLF